MRKDKNEKGRGNTVKIKRGGGTYEEGGCENLLTMPHKLKGVE